MDLVSRIQELMRERGWTYYRLAKEAGVPESTINSLQSRGNNPSVYTIQQCCKAFGISMSEFFSDDFFDGEYTPEERKLIKDLRNAPPGVMDGVKLIAASSARTGGDKNSTT